MIVCEYLFKEFNTKGSNEYMDSWASHVDLMAEEGWAVLECNRKPASFGLWTVPVEPLQSEALAYKVSVLSKVNGWRPERKTQYDK